MAYWSKHIVKEIKFVVVGKCRVNSCQLYITDTLTSTSRHLIILDYLVMVNRDASIILTVMLNNFQKSSAESTYRLYLKHEKGSFRVCSSYYYYLECQDCRSMDWIYFLTLPLCFSVTLIVISHATLRRPQSQCASCDNAAMRLPRFRARRLSAKKEGCFSLSSLFSRFRIRRSSPQVLKEQIVTDSGYLRSQYVTR